jgi:zinc transport system substrate-binding protein
MINLKRTFTFLQIAAVLAISTGCSSKHAKSTQKKQLLTSFYPVEIIVLNLVKDVPGIDVSMLTPPGTGCLHNYQLTPVDMSLIEKADCMVINGAGMEPFLDKIIHEKGRFTLIDASSKCDLLYNEPEPDHHDDDNDHHSNVNPHVWLSPTQYLIQIQTITNGLAHWDTAQAVLYRQNMEVYSQKIKQLQFDLDTLLKNLPSRDIVTFHAAFSYFARDYHLNVRAVMQQEPGQEPSASELAELIRIIKKFNIRSVFVEPQYRSKTADVVARETGVHVDTLDPIVTGEIVPDAYIKAMRKNGSVLYNALKREVPGNGD